MTRINLKVSALIRVIRGLVLGCRLGMVCVATAVASLVCVPAYAKKMPEEQTKRAELQELKSRIEALRKEIAEAEKARTDIADQLKEAERAISDANRSLRALGQERQQAQTEMQTLAEQARQIESRIAAQQAQLSTLLHRQYVSGQSDTLRQILSGNDPNQLARDLEYLKALSRGKTELIAALRDSLREKNALAAQAQNQADELAEIEKRSRSERSQLVNQQQAKRVVLDRIADRIKTRNREIGNLKQDEMRLARLIEGLSRVMRRPAPDVRAAPEHGESATPGASAKPAPILRNEQTPEDIAAGESFARLRGQLRLPVRGELISRFGAPRLEGGASWKGLFIRSTAGGEVKAIAAGRVVFADWLRGFGNLIIVDHGGSYLSVYGNNESVLKEVGEAVRGGDVIATIGNSGGNSESGLYFEIRYRGQAVDPLKWVFVR